MIADAHDDLRPLMFSVAYRMLGSVVEAEDVVQEAFLKMTRSVAEGGTGPDNLDAWATTVTTRPGSRPQPSSASSPSAT